MWLLPALSVVSRVAGRVYYRLTISGARVPHTGPVLLVANHPNAMLDPMLVAGATRRAVRFLGKATLFADTWIGWLVRATGAIPVYRRADDPSAMGHNVGMFHAVQEALAQGSAVGIFPEGITHGGSSLVPLKTGAARIALAVPGRPFPIVPIGLVFRQKEVFRSRAAVIVGEQVDWADLAERGAEDPDAVRELTDRIDEALRRVTVNLEQWADRPLAECAVRIWEVERGTKGDRAERVARLKTTTMLLARARADGSGRWERLIKDVAAHDRRLRRLGLGPWDLKADVSLGSGLRWSARQAWLLMLPAMASAALGFLVFWPAYRATALVVNLVGPDTEQRSSHSLVIGIVLYAVWLLALATATTLSTNVTTGVVVLILLPVIGVVGLAVRERWRGAWNDVRRFFLLRSRRSLVRTLQERQHALRTRLEEMRDILTESE